MKQNLPNICVECNKSKPFYGLLDYYDTPNMPHCKECFKDKIEKAKDKYIKASTNIDKLPITLEKLVENVLSGNDKSVYYILDNNTKIEIKLFKYNSLFLFILSNEKAVTSLHMLEEQLENSNIPNFMLYYSLLDKIVLLRNFK